MKALTLISHLSMYLKGGSPQFRADLPKCISNSEAQIENGVAYKKVCTLSCDRFLFPGEVHFHGETHDLD